VTPARDPTAHALLRERAEATPRAIESTARSAERFAREHRAALARASRWWVSGVGASEGVARACAASLRRLEGRSAEFVPFSQWLTQQPPADTAVIVFSQGLSPNARIALSAPRSDAPRVLVTAAVDHPEAKRAVARGWLVCEHEPASEDALLVRVTGPACALAAGLAIVDSLSPAQTSLSRDANAGAAFEAGLRQGRALADQHGVEALSRVRGILCAGGSCESLSGLAWAWMESTLTAPVAVWDVLAFAHGPFQALFERQATLVAFEQDRADERALFDRLARVLDPTRHTLVRVRAQVDGPLSTFAQHGALWGLALSLLDAQPRALDAWPGKGLDGPLYDVGGDDGAEP
jgi:creatinine amidohydrolase